jgi:hypothetical protein
MNSIVRCLLAVTLVAALGRPAGAQTIHDFAAWLAMMSTPYGSLPPVVTRRMAGQSTGIASRSSFELRYGHFAFDNQSDAVHIGGIGARFGAVGLVAGYEGCSGCDGGLMLGADYEGVVVQQLLTGNGARSLFTLGLRPSIGFGRSLGSGPDVSSISAAVDVPFSVAVPVGTTARMVPFIAPGFGVGALRGGGESESGTRGSIAFGAALVDLSPGLGINLSWRKVFLDQAPTTIGVALTFDR